MQNNEKQSMRIHEIVNRMPRKSLRAARNPREINMRMNFFSLLDCREKCVSIISSRYIGNMASFVPSCIMRS